MNNKLIAFGTTGGIGLIIFLWLLVNVLAVVDVGQVGILTQFGQVKGELQSGFHFKSPFQSVTTMNVQIQKNQVNATAATQDLQNVTTTVALNYHLTQATANQVYREVGVTYVETIIDPILQETVKSVTSQYNATDLIDQRPAVEAKTLTDLQAALTKRGITVDNLSIVNFEFSNAFSTAIEDKQVAAQNVLKQQYNLQAAQLQAQAQETQKQSLSSQYLELQAIQKWDGKLPNTLAGNGTVFNIPLQGQ